MISATDMLAHMSTRRSVRDFSEQPVRRETLVRCLEAANSAPSATNRQPWRFVVVTDPELRSRLADLVRQRTEALDAAIEAGPHAEEWAGYGDFFWQPLASCSAIVVPCLRVRNDTIAGFLRSAGRDPEAFARPSLMHPERCALGAAAMAFLLQAHAEKLGAVWMAGPMVAKSEIEAELDVRPPWQMVGAIAVGHPVSEPPKTGRRDIGQVVTWMERDNS